MLTNKFLHLSTCTLYNRWWYCHDQINGLNSAQREFGKEKRNQIPVVTVQNKCLRVCDIWKLVVSKMASSTTENFEVGDLVIYRHSVHSIDNIQMTHLGYRSYHIKGNDN